jgi:signal transduction histidine kinase
MTVRGNAVTELELPELLAAAACAIINERHAAAYAHDVRGTMQALFGAFELLGRSAKAGADTSRVEKASDLARRSITHHEKSTMHVLDLLTQQPADPTPTNLTALLPDVAHFLRHMAALKDVNIVVSAAPDLWVLAQTTKLQMLLVGLLTEAIDDTPAGAELGVRVDRVGDGQIALSIGLPLFAAITEDSDAAAVAPRRSYRPRELILAFARQFLTANQGRLSVDLAAPPHGTLSLYFPRLQPDRSAA